MKALIAVAALMVALVGGSRAEPDPSSAGPDDDVQVTAQVAKLDLAARDVTFETLDGKKLQVTFSTEVRGIDKLKVGTLVRIHYLKLIVFPGSHNASSTAQRIARLAGDGVQTRPMLVIVRRVTGTVQGIDRKAGVLAARIPTGDTIIVKTGEGGQCLEQVHIGDSVDLRCTEAVAFQFLL